VFWASQQLYIAVFQLSQTVDTPGYLLLKIGWELTENWDFKELGIGWETVAGDGFMTTLCERID